VEAVLKGSDQSLQPWLWGRCGLLAPGSLQSAEAAPAWPVAMAARPAEQEESGGRWPCLGWETCPCVGSWGGRARTAGALG
jgi:hypothetical protein